MERFFHRHGGHKRSKYASNSISTPVAPPTLHYHSASITGNERASAIAPLGTPARAVKGSLKCLPQVVIEHDDRAVVDIMRGDAERAEQRAQLHRTPLTSDTPSSRRERRLTPMPPAQSPTPRPLIAPSSNSRSLRAKSASNNVHDNAKSDSAVMLIGRNTAAPTPTHASSSSYGAGPSTHHASYCPDRSDPLSTATMHNKTGTAEMQTHSIRRTGTLDNPVSAKAPNAYTLSHRESVISSYATDDNEWSSRVKSTDGMDWLSVVNIHKRLSVAYGSESSGHDSGYASGSARSNDGKHTATMTRDVGSSHAPARLTTESNAHHKGFVSRASPDVLPREERRPPRSLVSDRAPSPTRADYALLAPRRTIPPRRPFPFSSMPLPPIPSPKSELIENEPATRNPPSLPPRPPGLITTKSFNRMTEEELDWYYEDIRDMILKDCGRWLGSGGDQRAAELYNYYHVKGLSHGCTPLRAARVALDRVMQAVKGFCYHEVTDPRYADVLVMNEKARQRVRRKTHGPPRV